MLGSKAQWEAPVPGVNYPIWEILECSVARSYLKEGRAGVRMKTTLKILNLEPRAIRQIMLFIRPTFCMPAIIWI